MATTSTRPSSSKRKRNQETDAAAMPLYRSRRVAFRDPFRFNDLAPELRNEIYSMALRNEVSRCLRGTSLPLTGKMTAPGLSLSSRGVYEHILLQEYFPRPPQPRVWFEGSMACAELDQGGVSD